jgi:hypothetical protein
MSLPAQDFATSSNFCSNPKCSIPFNLDKANAQIQKSGIVYADCGDVIYQGYKCPNPECRGLRFVRCDRNNPLFDLRDFIMTPHPNPDANVIEQLIHCKDASGINESLKFKFIPAWDAKTVSTQNLANYYPDALFNSVLSSGIPYIMTETDFKERLQKEIETAVKKLRRLYPDVPKFRSLLTCLAPNKITEIEELDGIWTMKAENDGSSAKEFEEKYSAWRVLLEESGGKALKEAVVEHLENKGITKFDKKEVSLLIERKLANYQRLGTGLLREHAKKVGFEETIWSFFKKPFKEIFYSVCTELALQPQRTELTEWVNKAEKGKALFVDAPMGLGKTFSIVEALAENSKLSAVIFMPTKKLCEKIIRRLKEKIAANKGVDYWETYHKLDNREFLESEVYYADGINPDECLHFGEIVQRYRQNWIKRQDLCTKCLMERECRFNSHWKEAPRSRIVVATHHKYDNFCKQSNIRRWYKDGYYKTDENGNRIKGKDGKDEKLDGVERDFFIVDEDLVLSQCYQPINLEYKELHEFLVVVRDFIDQFSATEKLNDKIFNFFGRVGLCKKTSFIRPIDSKFRFPKIIRKEWEESNKNLLKVLSNIDEPPVLVGNHLEMIEDAIRLGIVVQKYHNRHRIYFPNSKSYNLSKLPPHVFFDGTMIDRRFLKKKLKKVQLKFEKIPVKPLWSFKVWQNTNTDLSKTKIDLDKEKVKNLLNVLLNAIDRSHKYLILSSKATKNIYLEKFLDTNFPFHDFVKGHYGYIRGINEAKECNVGIMLGSYLPSDAVEIAMALEFIQKVLPKKATTPTYVNFWSWKGSKSRRAYKRKFGIISKMAETLRYCEHRQAMARSRYLFHDVDFYVLSKDPVKNFEPYAQIMDENFREDIFPPRAERSDSKYEEIKEKVLNLLQKEGKLGEMDFHLITGHSRTTLRKHLKRMLDDDGVPIVRDGMKYTLPECTLPKGV